MNADKRRYNFIDFICIYPVHLRLKISRFGLFPAGHQQTDFLVARFFRIDFANDFPFMNH